MKKAFLLAVYDKLKFFCFVSDKRFKGAQQLPGSKCRGQKTSFRKVKEPYNERPTIKSLVHVTINNSAELHPHLT